MVETIEYEQARTETVVETETKVICKLCEQEFDEVIPVSYGHNQHGNEYVVDTALCRTCAASALDIVVKDEHVLPAQHLGTERPDDIVTAPEKHAEIALTELSGLLTVGFVLGIPIFLYITHQYSTWDTLTLITVIILLGGAFYTYSKLQGYLNSIDPNSKHR